MIPALSTGAADAPEELCAVASAPSNPNARGSFFLSHDRTKSRPRSAFTDLSFTRTKKKSVVTIKCDNNTVIGRQMLKTSAFSFLSEDALRQLSWEFLAGIFCGGGIKLLDRKYISWK